MKILDKEQTKFVESIVREMISLTRQEDEAVDRRSMADLHAAGEEKSEVWRQFFAHATISTDELN